MPIYEYRCDECDEKFELFVRSTSQKAVPTCPECGSQKARKNIEKRIRAFALEDILWMPTSSVGIMRAPTLIKNPESKKDIVFALNKELEALKKLYKDGKTRMTEEEYRDTRKKLIKSGFFEEELVQITRNEELTVKKLVNDLGNDKFNVREAADKELRKIGKKALTYLREAKKSNDPEVKSRVERLIRDIEITLNLTVNFQKIDEFLSQLNYLILRLIK